MELKRVVVTGLGVLSPLGNSVDVLWDNLKKGVSGAAPITKFDTANYKTKFACEVRDFDPADYGIDRKEARKHDLFAQYAIATATQAMDDSGLDSEKIDKDRAGIIWGSGIGGLQSFFEEVRAFRPEKPQFTPFFITKMIANIAGGLLSIKYGFRGPNYTTVTACASSSHAIIEAFNKIRDGFVMGEGSGALILEEYEYALRRGANIYAEVIGGGMSADAYHMTAPDPDGTGAQLVMKWALEDAGIAISEVDYINVHGTSTPLGDIAEPKAILGVFGEHSYRLSISATKSMTGHLLGAAGAIEGIATILALRDGIIPPTINHFTDDPEIDNRLDFTFNKARERDIRIAISNTFGFGGHNATLAFKKF